MKQIKKRVRIKAKIPTGWWPDFIAPLTDADLVHDGNITVAEITNPSGPESYRQVFTALVPLDLLDDVLSSREEIDCDIEASGPHPSFTLGDKQGGYVPRFWIYGGTAVSKGFEPLVLSWQSANRRVLSVDPGFLMTYALVPRPVQASPSQFELHWDDLEVPILSVVISQLVSVHSFPLSSCARVGIRREYLEDYAFVRGCALVHFFYIHGEGIPKKEAARVIGGKHSLSIRTPGTRFDIFKTDDSTNVHKVRVWGTRLLFRPVSSPISIGRWDYGALIWPGHSNPISHNSLPMMEEVFVRDSVLENYEGREGFSIIPDSGAVSYGSQWAVSHIRRVGRDLFAVEVRKLYEGLPPPILRLWHSYAVRKPLTSAAVLRQQANVATRAKKLIFGLLGFGETFAEFQSRVLSQDFSSSEIVGLDRKNLRYAGWWSPPLVEKITRHIPIEMTEDKFLERCEDLTKLLIESLHESDLRRLLRALGCSDRAIDEMRSLRLLDRILSLCKLSIDTGISLLSNYQELETRRATGPINLIIPHLFALNELRILKAHKTDESYAQRLNRALKEFNVDKSLSAGGWGVLADRVYNALADELEEINEIVSLWRINESL